MVTRKQVVTGTLPHYCGKDVPLPIRGEPLADYADVAVFAHNIRTADTIPLVVAGDCIAATSVQAGAQSFGRPAPFVVWIDAHGDYHTPRTTPSGHPGGMALSILCGINCGEQWPKCRPMSQSRVVHLGGTDFDGDERLRMELAGVRFDVNDIPTDEPLHVHIDMDATDSPAMDYPAPGGWAWYELWDQILAPLQRQAVAWSISTHNPDHQSAYQVSLAQKDLDGLIDTIERGERR